MALRTKENPSAVSTGEAESFEREVTSVSQAILTRWVFPIKRDFHYAYSGEGLSHFESRLVIRYQISSQQGTEGVEGKGKEGSIEPDWPLPTACSLPRSMDNESFRFNAPAREGGRPDFRAPLTNALLALCPQWTLFSLSLACPAEETLRKEKLRLANKRSTEYTQPVSPIFITLQHIPNWKRCQPVILHTNRDREKGTTFSLCRPSEMFCSHNQELKLFFLQKYNLTLLALNIYKSIEKYTLWYIIYRC